MSGHEIDGLTPAGCARRAEILERVLLAADARRRRRVVARSLALALPIVVATTVVWAFQQQRSVLSRSPQVAVRTTPAPAPTTIRRIATDPTLVARWSAPERSLSAVRLDDSELLSLLSSAGRATGLVRVGGAVTVVGLNPDEPPRPSGRSPAADPINYASGSPPRKGGHTGV